MSSTKLYIGNLPDGTKEKDVRELFQAFGEVDEVAVMRGYAFVHFAKSEDANAALNALDDSEFMGSHIQVQIARTKGHGYGRGSGVPRPRIPRGISPNGRGYRDSYRERGGGRYGPYPRDYDRYDYYDRYGGRDYDYDHRYDRYGGRGYDRYDYDRYDRYERGYDYGSSGGGSGRYSDYRQRSRSPPRDYYSSSRDGRGDYSERDSYRDSYRESSRRW